MNTNAQIGYGTWEDLIFCHRNKNYGAYLLRKEHDKHMIYGFLISILPLLMLFIFSLTKKSVVETTIILPAEPWVIPTFPPEIIPPIEETSTITCGGGGDVKDKSELPEEIKALLVVDEKNDKKTEEVKKEIEEDKTTDEVDPNQAFGNGESDNPDASLTDGNTEGSGVGTRTTDGTGTEKIYEFDPDNLDRPEFIGGDKALMKYLQNNIKRPNSGYSQEDNLVKVVFVIDTEGKIESAELLKSAGNPYDSEALRVVKNMPKWKPGKHGDKPAKFRMILPIRFVGRN